MSSPPSKIQMQNVGDSVKLNCCARGLLLPKVKWFKDGSIISTAAHQENDFIKSEVVIHRFKPSDAGIYSCLFENDKNGTAEANTSLSMRTVDLFFFLFLLMENKFIFCKVCKEQSFCEVFFLL